MHNFTDNHYTLQNKSTIPPTFNINYETWTKFDRQSLYTTEYDCNSNDNHIKLLNKHTIPQAIPINY